MTIRKIKTRLTSKLSVPPKPAAIFEGSLSFKVGEPCSQADTYVGKTEAEDGDHPHVESDHGRSSCGASGR